MMPSTQSPPPLRAEHISGARRFFGDLIIAFRVLNEVRHRAVAAVFGVQKGWRSNLLTAIVIGAVMDAIGHVAAAPRTQVRKLRSSRTVVGDSMIVAAILNEAIDRLTTRRAKATAAGTALIVFAVVANSIRPTVERVLRAIRPTVRGVITEARKVRDAISRYGSS